MTNLSMKFQLQDGVSAPLKQIEQQTRRTTKEMDGMGESADGLGEKTGSAAEGMDGLIGGVAALGVAFVTHKLADFLWSTAEAAIGFESAITGVYKTVDGTAAQLGAISDEIRAMATEIPATTTEIASVAEAAGQLGIATADVTAFTRVMLDLGESTNLTSDAAASSLAKLANITGLDPADYERLGSTIVDLGNNFATTEADIVNMSTRLASAGHLAGMSEADILGLSAAFSSVGIEAESGGTSISKMISMLQTAVETGSAKLQDYADVAGVSASQFKTAFEHDAAGALYAFIAGLSDFESSGKSATVMLSDLGISEQRLTNALKASSSANGMLKNSIATANRAWEENTALAEEAGKRYATLESRLQLTKNAGERLKTAMGEGLTPALGAVADAGKTVLNGLAGFLENSPVATSLVSGLSVALVGLGGSLVVLGAVELPMVTTAIKTFTAALAGSPLFGLAIGGAVIAGIATFAVSMENARDKTTEAEKAYQEFLAGMELDTAEISALEDSLADLAGKTNLTAAEQHELQGTITALNEALPELKLNYDDLTGSADGYLNALGDIDKQVKNKQMQTITDEIVQLKLDRAPIMAEYEKAEAPFKEKQAQYDKEYLAYTTTSHPVGSTFMGSRLTFGLEDDRKALEKLGERVKESDKLIKDATDRLEDFAKAEDAAAPKTLRFADAMSQLFAPIDDKHDNIFVQQLTAAVEESQKLYDTIYSNIDSAAGLFDELKAETELSASDMLDNLASESKFLEDYASNLEKAKKLEIDEGIIAGLSDGTEEHAGELANIVARAGKEGGKGFVKELNKAFRDVKDKKTITADIIFGQQDQFEVVTGEVGEKLKSMVGEMDLSTEAKTAAEDTIDAYINAIRGKVFEAGDAAAMVKAAVNGELSEPIEIKGLERADERFARQGAGRAYASGTTNAARGWALVGEEGPELRWFAGGETVLPAPETRDLLQSAASQSETHKTVTLEIKGSGSMSVSPGTTPEQVWTHALPDIKTALMSILRQEIFEEGDLAYGF